MRDYGIDLVEQLPDMTWRRFLALCQNLSPHGAVAVRIRAQQEMRDRNEMTLTEQERRAADEEDARAAAAFFSSVVSV